VPQLEAPTHSVITTDAFTYFESHWTHEIWFKDFIKHTYASQWVKLFLMIRTEFFFKCDIYQCTYVLLSCKVTTEWIPAFWACIYIMPESLKFICKANDVFVMEEIFQIRSCIEILFSEYRNRQLISICSTVNKELLGIHTGEYSSINRYFLFKYVWPIVRRL